MDKKPTKKQLELLLLLYKFRFITVELACKVLNARSANSLRDRLAKLVEQGYVGRRYDASYRIKSRHAEYFLLSKGVAALKQQTACNEAVLHNMHKDKTASNTFVHQKLAIMDAYCHLQGTGVKFLTQSQLAGFSGFPKPLPDGFMSFKNKQGSVYFFLEVFREAEPFFVALHRRAKRFVEYSESGDWQIAQKSRPFPAVLLVCETPSLQKRISKKLSKLVEATWSEELRIYSTTIKALANGGIDKNIWQVMGEEEAKQVSLQNMN